MYKSQRKSPKKSKRKSSKRKSPKKSKRKSPKKSKRKSPNESPKKSQMKSPKENIKKVINKKMDRKKNIKKNIKEHIKKEEEEEKQKFITLCKKHIIDNDLDHVYHKKHLSNNECDIYLIGENHEVHNESSTIKGILEMFKELVMEKKDVMIDLMIEIDRKSVKSVIETVIKTENDENDIQMFQVRDYFMLCLRNKNCGRLHVHWLDHGYEDEEKLEYTNKYHLFPDWYKGLLLELGLSLYNGYFLPSDDIIDSFNPDTNEKDIFLLLTKNPFIQKEILHIEEKKERKEMKKYIKKFDFFFNNIYVIFFNIYKNEKKEFIERKKDIEYKEEKTSIIVYKMLRYVMDFYTILRIINLNLKNVIIYAGQGHTINIEYILKEYCDFI
jgi:hypothetical protein